MSKSDNCPICGKKMREFNDVRICVDCNDRYGDYYNFFSRAVQEFKGSDGREMVIIECPGATIYADDNMTVARGVKWNDPGDFSRGFVIVDKPVYAPNHQAKRAIPKEKANNICRCQACQDFTIKMRTYNNQRRRDQYSQDSPMMPSQDPGEDFSPLSDLK